MILRSSGLPVRVGGITCYHARQEQKWLKHGHFEAATCFPCLTAPIPRKAALQLQFHSTRHSWSLELELERTIHKEGKDFQGERAISEKTHCLASGSRPESRQECPCARFATNTPRKTKASLCIPTFVCALELKTGASCSIMQVSASSCAH